MTDIENTVRAGLGEMADDLGWPGLDVEGVLARHRSARRARHGAVAVVTAVVLAVSLPMALASSPASPDTSAGNAAAPRTAEPSPDTAGGDLAVDGMTEAETAQALADLAAARARGAAEIAAVGACMTQAGWQVTVVGDGVQWSGSGQSAAAYDAQMAACQAAYPEPAPLSEVALRLIYRDYLTAYDCLIAAGWTPEPPVDEASFLASGGGAWYPSFGIPQEEMTPAAAACPVPQRLTP